MKAILIYLKHFLVVSAMILGVGFVVIVSQKGSIGFGKDTLAHKVGGEGPHLFYEDNYISSLTIKGGREQGFFIEETQTTVGEPIDISVYFPFDDSRFSFQTTPKPTATPVHYTDNQPIFALSDLEGNYKAFRDMLLTSEIVDKQLNWSFGEGHLVLIGDMVDRGDSTTQLLWLIYKLEQEALLAGGQVHYIIGNHEIKNLQGNFRSASNKYIPIAGLLGKTQYNLFDSNSVIGRWLENKNTLELINGHLFVHGGLHPDIATLDMDLQQINDMIKSEYRHYYYPKKGHHPTEKLLTSTTTGPAWYRGLFKGEVSQQQLAELLTKFSANALVVGHTIQFKVNKQFDGKLFAIDVKHPGDYQTNFPSKSSEGLLINQGRYYRVLDDGQKIAL
ncbi:metallophosphoesterase [Paraglaciecola arctica]|uniref:metallophosphoesterase n=1 Tax=Paraglaciecola arctica TaxID=1128911 RepID=UPI001C072362|nr:metallophosphoesterase [Paraglaciecola arctica]MBU3006118.1 metallophosphoesterase [Paraglaciecola arctica]